MNNQDTQDIKVKKSLKFSFIDGIFASGMVGFTQDYFTPFLLLLGGNARQVGLLNALPNLFASLAQLKSADLTEKFRSRRIIINTSVLLQAMMLIPIAAIAILQRKDPRTFIFLVVLFTSLGAFATASWASLMSDLVGEKKRGEYFGWRNRLLGIVTIITAFLSGIILHLMKKLNTFYGFAIIFGCAFVFRFISWYYLTRMHEPKLEFHNKHYFSIIDFISRFRESNFAKFVLFVALMNFSVNLASPFFSVLMLRDLRFSYFLYSVITTTATITIYSTISRWGRVADKVGNLRILKFTAPIIAILPTLWVFNRSPFYLLIAQVVSGFAWAGFNLCATNFIFDAAIPEKRTRCVAYFNVFNGLALCLGAVLGGFLASRMPLLFGYRLLSLFLLSSSLRILVAFLMPLKLKEVRPVENVSSYNLFFSVIGIKPLLGIERKASRY